VAGGELNLLAAQDYDYSLYQKKKKGSFGRKSFKGKRGRGEKGTDLFFYPCLGTSKNQPFPLESESPNHRTASAC